MIYVFFFYWISLSLEMLSDFFKVKMYAGDRIWIWDVDMNIYKLNNYGDCFYLFKL